MNLRFKTGSSNTPGSSSGRVAGYHPSHYQGYRAINRLSDAFRNHSPFPIGNLAPLSCNIRALEAASDFARGIHNQVAIVGPCGWGKSHLLTSAAQAIELYQDRRVRFTDATSWALHFRHVTDPTPLILDDVQEVLTQNRAKHFFREALARRSELGRATLLGYNSHVMCRELHELLPVAQPWVIATIKEPDVEDRELVVRQIARRHGVTMSRSSRRIVAQTVAGNAYSIGGAMRRIKLIKDDWTQPEDTLQLCGILIPHMADGAEWDPRDLVFNVVHRVLEGVGNGKKVSREITAYIFCKDMALSESEAAAYLNLPPGEVYRWVSIVKELLVQPEVDRAVQACRNAVLQSVCQL